VLLRALAFHAEKLHDDQVWRRVERIARWMGRKDLKATFFVYPFRAQVAARDITERVQTLASLGHEIGQHTHFYAGTKIDKPEKVDDLSQANIMHCLYRDFETLRQMGFPPKGFTAGAWFMNQTILDTLVEVGFAYDCSAQFPKPKEVAHSSDHRWLQLPQLHTNSRGQLVCLPTTYSLGEWFKWGHKMRTEGQVLYQLVYLHDYDLLSFHYYLLLWCFMYIVKGHHPQSAATIAEQYLLRGEYSDV
jgi:hypothetical protein